MTIDPKTLPDGTLVSVGLVDAMGSHLRHVNDSLRGSLASGAVEVVRVFVPVPDGVAYDDALRAVNDARPWVEWGDRTFPKGARVRTESVSGEIGTLVRFVHPDDVPDPDADLIERIARVMCDDVGGDCWEDQPDTDRDAWRGTARAALAVIREDQP